MKMEITKYNHEKVIKQLNTIATGSSFAIGNANYYGVKSITSDFYHVYEGDPIPGEWDGGGEDRIEIKFSFDKDGQACISFRPDEEHCEVAKEMDDLWIFRIEDIPSYVIREKEYLDYRLKEYEKYMTKGDE